MFPFSTDTVTLCLNVSRVGAICKSSTFKKMIKSGSIHFKKSLIVTDIVRRVIVFSCILIPTCRYSHFHNLAQWKGDQACFYLVWCIEYTMLLSYNITYKYFVSVLYGMAPKK